VDGVIPRLEDGARVARWCLAANIENVRSVDAADVTLSNDLDPEGPGRYKTLDNGTLVDLRPKGLLCVTRLESDHRPISQGPTHHHRRAKDDVCQWVAQDEVGRTHGMEDLIHIFSGFDASVGRDEWGQDIRRSDEMSGPHTHNHLLLRASEFFTSLCTHLTCSLTFDRRDTAMVDTWRHGNGRR
jgi:hypothetical protein